MGGAPPRLNCAARVGSIVCVTRGVEVGGGSMIGSNRWPVSRVTKGAYTQATLPGTPGYTIWIHSPPGDLPNAEAAAKKIISLPMFPEITDEQIDFVCESLNNLLNYAEK